MKKFLLTLLFVSSPCFAWDGINSTSGNTVDFWADRQEITEGGLTEVVDYESGNIKHVDVMYSDNNTIEAIDIETGEIEFYDMD